MSDCTCIRGDDGQVKVPRSRCPQHGWVDAPTPAPALTDEEIDVNLKIIRDCAASLTRAVSAPGLVDRTVAAVIAKAKREERELVAHLIDGEMDVLTEDGQPLSSDEAAEYDALSRVRGYMQESTR